jgi:predicted dehydrogenase
MAENHQQLRVGVVGLGRRWRRHYRPALLHLLDRFDLRCVCDPVPAIGERAARQLGCQWAVGPVELLARGDVDVVLLLDPGWWRLWPLELAARCGKPVFCAASLACDGGHADLIRERAQAAGLPVQMALLPRLAPAAARLDMLLTNDLGPARLVIGDVDLTQKKPLLERLDLGLVDWCARIVGKPPVQVTAHELPGPGLAAALYECPESAAIQFLCRRMPLGQGGVRVQVVAERGVVEVLSPRRLRWVSAEGRHVHVLPRPRPVGRVLLEQFHDAVISGRLPQPDLEEVYRAWQWLRAARRSCQTGAPCRC